MFTLASTSMQVFHQLMDTIESAYQSTYTIENSEDWHKIVICAKSDEQVGKNLLIEYFQKNNDLFKSVTNVGLLHRDYDKIIPKLIYRREKRLISA
jgi:hypothetical protein